MHYLQFSACRQSVQFIELHPSYEQGSKLLTVSQLFCNSLEHSLLINGSLCCIQYFHMNLATMKCLLSHEKVWPRAANSQVLITDNGGDCVYYFVCSQVWYAALISFWYCVLSTKLMTCRLPPVPGHSKDVSKTTLPLAKLTYEDRQDHAQFVGWLLGWN